MDTIKGTENPIGNRIRQLRLLRGMHLADLQQATGIHATWLSRIETGRGVPTPEELEKIKAALRWPENAAEAFAILEGTK